MIMNEQDYSYPLYAKILHLGLAVFGITAFLTGELAEEGSNSFGYLLHAYLGLSLALFILMRFISGLSSSRSMKFSAWSLFSRQQWGYVLQDFRSLLRLKMPERRKHEGLAGLTQAFGLLIFGLMALTGTGLFLLGGGPESGLFEVIEEVHEIGESLIPLYLLLHVGAVILHTIAGHSIWKRMFRFARA
jgi:cytochrome b561